MRTEEDLITMISPAVKHLNACEITTREKMGWNHIEVEPTTHFSPLIPSGLD